MRAPFQRRQPGRFDTTTPIVRCELPELVNVAHLV
jgi:hypothetical protein